MNVHVTEGALDGAYYAFQWQHDDGAWHDCDFRGPGVYAASHGEVWRRYRTQGFMIEEEAVRWLLVMRGHEHPSGSYHERVTSWRGQRLRVVRVSFSVAVTPTVVMEPVDRAVPLTRPA